MIEMSFSIVNHGNVHDSVSIHAPARGATSRPLA